VGTVIDAASDRADLLPGSKVDLPLWMVPAMAGRNMLQVGRLVWGGLVWGIGHRQDCKLVDNRAASKPHALRLF
jgi:hypothetical protein